MSAAVISSARTATVDRPERPTRVTPQLHASLVRWLDGPAAADALTRKGGAL